MKKYKVRVAASGYTASDGRFIQPEWIIAMAKSYNPEVYQARINLEHIRGILPDSQFKAFGDVHALESKLETIDGVGRQCLYATIEPTEELLQINKRKQKIFTSIEIEPNFSKTNSPYLIGLAVTDSPASLCTEALKFKSDCKLSEKNIFSPGYETHIDLDSSIHETNETQVEQINNHSSQSPSNQPISDELINQFSDQIGSVKTSLDQFMNKLETIVNRIDKLTHIEQDHQQNDFSHNGSDGECKTEY